MNKEKAEYGTNIVGYIRNTLNSAGIPWAECEKIGEHVQAHIESLDWLSTDTGTTFEKTFTVK